MHHDVLNCYHPEENNILVNLRSDLHIHSRFSDGNATPEEIVIKADILGLACISITDHDELGGIEPAQKVIEKRGADVILLPGAELTSYDQKERELHILAYGFDHTDRTVIDFLENFKKQRLNRIKKMILLLSEIGIKVNLEDVVKKSGQGTIGRVHLAKVLVKNGYAKTISEVFYKYIGSEGKAYVSKEKILPKDIIAEIHKWGGVAILSHPSYFADFEQIESFLDMGIDGFEAYHPNVDRKLCKQLKKLAKRTGSLITGGSDTHGSSFNRPDVGGCSVPYHFVEELFERLKIKK